MNQANEPYGRSCINEVGCLYVDKHEDRRGVLSQCGESEMQCSLRLVVHIELKF